MIISVPDLEKDPEFFVAQSQTEDILIEQGGEVVAKLVPVGPNDSAF